MDFTSVAMTCFFLISGFSIYYSSYNIDFGKKEELIRFYIKRLTSILPAYYFSHFIWIIFMEENSRESLLLMPIELLGIQTIYHSLFNTLHNGGTWFISCILISYFFYPTVHSLLKAFKRKGKLLLFAVLMFILIYSIVIVNEFSLASLYSNPFYRFIEFTLGATLAGLLIDLQREPSAHVNKVHYIILFLSMVSIYYSNTNKVYIGSQPFYAFVSLPFLCLMFISGYHLRSTRIEKSKVLQYVSSLTYYFFLSQLFVWKISMIILEALDLSRNRHKLMVSFSVAIIFSLALSELINKPINKILKPITQKQSR